ncbi:MAG: response regulator [Desulfuromonas sp.]|nr:MAG: response regulator [Desulfuromonas sp.]
MKKILIVDDEKNARDGLGELLRREGYDVSTAENGEAALDLLQRRRINLVITDIKMPKMNGLAFLQILQRDYPQIGVVMMTAYGGVETYLDAMRSGAVEYIIKPVRLDDLKQIMQRIFGEILPEPA